MSAERNNSPDASRKLKSPKDLAALREQARAGIDLRSGPKDVRVTVHMGTCGIAAGAREVLTRFMAELGRAGVTTVTLQQTGCAGLCHQEPMVTVTDGEGRVVRYGRLDDRRVAAIVREHLIGGSPVMDCVIASP